MPKIIEISGVIGIDVTANDIRQLLNEANGQPIVAEIGSPGGLVIEGIEIFNLFRIYTGHTTARIMSLAGSMSAIIPLAFDKIEAFSNSIFFVHQAITSIFDANKDDLEKRIGVLNGFDNILISALMGKSGKSKDVIEAMLKEDTFLFGAQILDNGFADNIIDSGEDLNRDVAVNNAMADLYACQVKIKDQDQQIDKIAALLTLSPAAIADPPKPAKAPVKPTSTQGKTMNEKEFLAFLETNPEAKAFYDSGMAYIKAVADAQPDFSAMALPELLALAPTAKTEHETALGDARATVEAGKLTAEAVKQVGNIIGSSEYGASIKAAGIKVLTGEKDHSSFEDMVALADETAEQIKSLQAKDEQPKDTPPDHNQVTKKEKTKAAATALSDAINDTQTKVQ